MLRSGLNAVELVTDSARYPGKNVFRDGYDRSVFTTNSVGYYY